MGKKLSTIIKQNNIIWDDISYKILIDGIVEQDENGNYLINVMIDFAHTSKEIIELFDDMYDLDFFFLRLQQFTGVKLYEKESLIIFR